MPELTPIGLIRTPFKEKFGIPRQASIINNFFAGNSCNDKVCGATVPAKIELISPYDDPNAFIGIDQFSHLWLSFGFHENDTKWRPLIRPPRLGGNEKIGVFASRSSFRPNNIGQSLVRLLSVDETNSSVSLNISCPDVLDGTPLYDIKPYISYSDYASNARCSYADTAPHANLNVDICEKLLPLISAQSLKHETDVRSVIELVVSCDPRPAYKKRAIDEKTYKLKLFDLDIAFTVKGKLATIIDIELLQ